MTNAVVETNLPGVIRRSRRDLMDVHTSDYERSSMCCWFIPTKKSLKRSKACRWTTVDRNMSRRVFRDKQTDRKQRRRWSLALSLALHWAKQIMKSEKRDCFLYRSSFVTGVTYHERCCLFNWMRQTHASRRSLFDSISASVRSSDEAHVPLVAFIDLGVTFVNDRTLGERKKSNTCQHDCLLLVHWSKRSMRALFTLEDWGNSSLSSFSLCVRTTKKTTKKNGSLLVFLSSQIKHLSSVKNRRMIRLISPIDQVCHWERGRKRIFLIAIRWSSPIS